MSPDPIRQELEAWIKVQRQALPERREEWAHGAAETLHDLTLELDRLFGNKNAARKCPCFLHYHPPRKWWHLTCACECYHDVEVAR